MAERGGYRKGSGRKPKSEEEKAKTLSLSALTSVFGSEEDAFKHVAKEAKGGSFPHLKMLFEYGYGKPKETVDANVTAEVIWKEHKTYLSGQDGNMG